MSIKRAFTLIETLIAAGVLFVAGSATVSLSNSLSTGTIANADLTVTNRWASEGLEVVSKIRDDNVLLNKKDPTTGEPVWFEPATGGLTNGYGWYKLVGDSTTGWYLEQLPSDQRFKLTFDQLPTLGLTDRSGLMTSDALTAWRLICFETASATVSGSETKEGELPCNLNDDGDPDDDGDPGGTPQPTCLPEDLYCQVVDDGQCLEGDPTCPPTTCIDPDQSRAGLSVSKVARCTNIDTQPSLDICPDAPCVNEPDDDRTVRNEWPKKMISLAQQFGLVGRAQAEGGERPSIPPGNLVKVRALVAWQDKAVWQKTLIATFITNWRGLQ